MPHTDSGYLQKLRNFQDLFDERAAVATMILASTSPAGIEISRFKKVLAGALAELANLYTAGFVDDNLPPEKRQMITLLEGNIAMATQQNLEIMRRMIEASDSIRPVARFRLGRLSGWMRRTTSSLEARGDVPFSIRISIPQILQADRKPLKTIRSLIGSSILRRPITELFARLDAASFLRADDVVFEGIDAALDQLTKYPKRVLVIILNHDLGVYDGTVLQRLAALLGSQKHVAMTRRGVYPLPPPAAGDVVYVDENDPSLRPVADSVRIIRDALETSSCVSLALAPEGMMPFTGGQMPLITKEGAYIIARRLAIELQELSATVLLIEVNSNFLKHLTTREVIAPRVKIDSVLVVPTSRVEKGKPDNWISERRLAAEMRFNADRGERMLNILDAKPLPGSKTYAAEPLGVLPMRLGPGR